MIDGLSEVIDFLQPIDCDAVSDGSRWHETLIVASYQVNMEIDLTLFLHVVDPCVLSICGADVGCTVDTYLWGFDEEFLLRDHVVT